MARWSLVKTEANVIDIKKAHLNGVLGPGEVAYVSLPDGCCEPGTCGRLSRWLYGMRPAASAWERDFTEKLGKLGKVRALPRHSTTQLLRPGVSFTVTTSRSLVGNRTSRTSRRS